MNINDALQQKIDLKTKPLGALGTLENIALQIGTIQNSIQPTISNPHIVIFAADHGITATGLVNPFPQAVTAQMVLNFVNGGAAINVFCKENNIELKVVDAGVNFEFDQNVLIINASIAKGTNNYISANAMSQAQLKLAIEKGGQIVEAIHKTGCNTIGFGEMGIGNTSAASLIMHYYLKQSVAECVGRGTGTNDEQLAIKINTLQAVSKHHNLENATLTTEQLLCCIGGFEIAMMTGAYLKAYELNMVILVDGFIATAALLTALHFVNENDATQKHNSLLSHCIFAHTSGEQGHQKILAHLSVQPLLNLGMRLGEGTGSALALPLLRSACAFVQNMASFETAGVDQKS